MMTCDLSVGTPRSTLAGGAVRMRRMTFLFRSEPFIVLVPSRLVQKSRSPGEAHFHSSSSFLYIRIPEMLGQAQFDLFIITIKFIYSTPLRYFEFDDSGEAKLCAVRCPAVAGRSSTS
jgi:hypothetical protein